MSSGTPSEENMKALIDAVAQVTSRPSIANPNSQALQSIQESATAMASRIGHSMGGFLLPASQVGPPRKRNHDSVAGTEVAAAAKRATKITEPDDTEKREKRLGQNRMAAVESRRRKKHMIEELQRSVQYYSRANTSLKSQNAELERELILAKHSVLTARSGNVQLKRPEDATSSAANITFRSAAAPEILALNSPTQQVQSSEQQSLAGHGGSLFVPSSASAYATKVDIDEQAQQAQFAATQALYTSMGYPAGAARFAASTLSQFVGQTGIAPVPSAPNDNTDDAHTKRIAAPIVAQQLKPPPTSSSDNALKSPCNVKSSKDDTYIDALNRFAMQQAAAANAAAAAATAAIQAARLHMQLKENGGSIPAPDAKSFPFSFPAGMAWPFQNPAQFPTKD
ncbi:hypothetical protein ACHAW5_009397 [Stephanodiscus triporus]|uniref:BZIP domain-containing protein n=1 Tax=Stephanodiscus triporus TaxID=2934178 RepID=A0ABD3PML2_9STRA